MSSLDAYYSRAGPGRSAKKAGLAYAGPTGPIAGRVFSNGRLVNTMPSGGKDRLGVQNFMHVFSTSIRPPLYCLVVLLLAEYGIIRKWKMYMYDSYPLNVFQIA